MTSIEIHDMTSDALAGEELQVLINGDWTAYKGAQEHWFNRLYGWRIKPTVEVNGVMMSKRQAMTAWEASGATSYEYTDMKTYWNNVAPSTPVFVPGRYYRWQEPKWIYVNGEKITQSGGALMYLGYAMDSQEDVEKLRAAINKLVEIK